MDPTGNDELYRLVFSGSPDAMIVFDLVDGRIEDANDAALELYGYGREEMLGKSLVELSGEVEATKACIVRLAGGETLRTAARIFKRRDGSVFTVDGHATALLVGGRKVGLSINRDISSSLRAQRELAESELRFRQLAENISQVFWMTDADNTRTEYISPRYETVFGRSCASLYADHRTWLEAILPEDRPGVIAAFEADKGRFDGTYRILRPDGDVRWIWARTFPVKDAEGRVVRVAGVAQDVTAQRKDEERLRESESLFEKAQEVANVGSWSYSIGEDEVSWSKETCRIFGVENDPRLPMADFLAFLHPDDRAANRRIRAAAVASGATYAAEYRVIRPDGALRWITSRADISRDENGRALKMVGIIQDVTDLRLNAEKLRVAERQTRESQKMEAVGRLAGGIAHDFNNILTAILGLAELSIDALPEGAPMRRDLEEIRLAGRRAAKLTQQLLAFSRRQAIVPKVLGLDDAVLGVSKMLCSIIGEDVKLAVSPNAGGVCVRADAGQLEQLIVNLAVNGRDAMPDGGVLTIATSAARLDAAAAAGYDGLKPGSYAVLTVSDTGTGIDESVQGRIFDPFFTTKEQGKGTGLGLATCYGIVKQNGGDILCDGRPGLGARFRILLPVCEPEGAACALPASPKAVRGTERVLVVEDEDSVRRVVVRMLQERGFETVEARDGQEGLDVLGRDADRLIRLVVTDMVMPGLGGRKMAAIAAVTRPDVRVLFTSGHTEDITEAFEMGAGCDFLQKPFSAEELGGRVRRALDVARR